MPAIERCRCGWLPDFVPVLQHDPGRQKWVAGCSNHRDCVLPDRSMSFERHTLCGAIVAWNRWCRAGHPLPGQSATVARSVAEVA